MANKFQKIFSRADEGIIQGLLGKDSLRLINLLFDKITPAQLRRFIIQLYTEEGMLTSRDIRAQLIDLLTPEESYFLARVLDVGPEGSLYERLKSLAIRSNTAKEQALLDFFEVPKTPQEKKEEHQSDALQTTIYPLFKHQREAARRISSALAEKNRVILHMPTGSGKTRTAMHIIADHLKQNEPALVIWLAYSEELCAQAAEEFSIAWNALGNRSVRLYRFWGNHEIEVKSLGEGFLVAGFSKVYSRIQNSIDFINTLSRKATFVIIDEAHQAIAETYSLILEALTVQNPSKGLLGLTATPGRTHNDVGVDEKLADFFLRQKIMLRIGGYKNPVDYLVEHGYLAATEFQPLFYEKGFELTEQDEEAINKHLDVPEKMLARIAADEKRSLAIINAVDKLIRVDGHKRIILFASTMEHSNILASALSLKGVKAFSVTSKTASCDRKRYIDSYKERSEEPIVLCNFGVLTTGFDAPMTSAAIIARPTKSLVLYSQMVGRAIRGPKAGGNKSATILTVVDFDLPGFKSVQQAFTNWEDIYE